RTEQTYRTSRKGVYAAGDARVGQSLIVTAIAEGRKCARIVNKDLGGSPMDADREMLTLGAWSGEADRTLRHEAEAAGTVRPGEEFFTGPGARGRFRFTDAWDGETRPCRSGNCAPTSLTLRGAQMDLGPPGL